MESPDDGSVRARISLPIQLLLAAQARLAGSFSSIARFRPANLVSLDTDVHSPAAVDPGLAGIVMMGGRFHESFTFDPSDTAICTLCPDGFGPI